MLNSNARAIDYHHSCVCQAISVYFNTHSYTIQATELPNTITYQKKCAGNLTYHFPSLPCFQLNKIQAPPCKTNQNFPLTRKQQHLLVVAILTLFCYKQCSNILKSMLRHIYVLLNMYRKYVPTHKGTHNYFCCFYK